MAASRTLLLDANLLVLVAVAGFDPRLIGKNTRLDLFDLADYDLLLKLIAAFSKQRTTPHVLAEVNNLADKCVPKLRLRQFRYGFAEFVKRLDEQWMPAAEICDTEAFRRLGLADAAIVQLAQDGTTVLSMDAQLCAELWGSGVEAFNFNHVRDRPTR